MPYTIEVCHTGAHWLHVRQGRATAYESKPNFSTRPGPGLVAINPELLAKLAPEQRSTKPCGGCPA